jgi:phosphonate transport system permease protein
MNGFIGTIIGSVIAFPLALLAATNVIKFRPLNFMVKIILAIFRTIPIFLIALVLL